MMLMTTLDALYDAYNQHNAEAAAMLYASGGVHEDVAYGRPKTGPEAIAKGLRHFLDAFPDAKWETHDRISSGDRAVARYKLTGTMQADLGPFRGHGQRIELRGVQVLELVGGKITRSEDFWDGATFERQVQHSDDAATAATTGREGTA